MSRTLKIKHYKDILRRYGIKHKKLTRKQIKKRAENIIAKKICSCIKKVKTRDEKKAIAICISSILKKRKLKVYRFSCKKRPRLLPKRKTRKKIFRY